MSARPPWHQGILYNNSIQTDVVIKCGSHSLYAHNTILMAASGLFYTAFSSNFSVAGASTYEIDGYEPGIVYTMIQFIYKAPFCDGLPGGKFERTLECFVLANEYQVPSLCRAITEQVTAFRTANIECLEINNDSYDGDRDPYLDLISALYRDNMIADRSLIEGVADMLTTKFCNTLIRTEVIELLYVRRTTCLSKSIPSPLSTMFRPVTMADYSEKDLEGDRSVGHGRSWMFGMP